MEKSASASIISTLETSLLNLSKSDGSHYDTTAQQIRETRAALLVISGVDVSKITDVSARMSELAAVEKRLDAAYKTIGEINTAIEKRRAELEKLKSDKK